MPIVNHTHNLHISICDDSNNIIYNDDLLETIYAEFANKYVKKNGNWLKVNFEIKLFWERVVLSKRECQFMGPLFICSAYSDLVLYEATKFVLNEIENKIKKTCTNTRWKIIFHISKLLENMDKIYEITIT